MSLSFVLIPLIIAVMFDHTDRMLFFFSVKREFSPAKGQIVCGIG